ncbi:MAG: hypothetical protein KA132_01245 [Thauera sp.]|nr:hypothetical protein [Thauera sp.]
MLKDVIAPAALGGGNYVPTSPAAAYRTLITALRKRGTCSSRRAFRWDVAAN